ncbi:hypothetical protein SNEBB_009921 [Seison nebaliae]|nr:hypothetical protein SNEBB_009921 [Seison nebaliae]
MIQWNGILLGLFIGISTLHGFISLLGVFVLISLIPIRKRFIQIYIVRYGIDFVINQWMLAMYDILAILYNIRIVIYGDIEDLRNYHQDNGERMSLVLMNHRTRLDWMYLWFPLCVRSNRCGRMRIILKETLSKLPGLGWSMQVASYIFLKRRWNLDQETICNYLKYYEKICSKTNDNYILLFPEGTDFSESTIVRSNNFIEENDIPLKGIRHVICPRSTGLIYIVNELNRLDIFDAIYDITISFDKQHEMAQGETDIFFNILPPKIHFVIKRYSKKQFLTQLGELNGEKPIETWLFKLWRRKDNLLKHFYKTAINNNDEHHYTNEMLTQEVFSDNKTVDVYREEYSLFHWTAPIRLSGWIAFLLWITYLLIYSKFFRYYYSSILVLGFCNRLLPGNSFGNFLINQSL